MDITAVDRSAISGATLLHRAAPSSKLVATALLLAAVVSVNDPLVAAGVMLSLTGAAAAVRLPLRQMLVLALYPAVFALIFAFAAAANVPLGALVVLKAVTAAFAVVTLMFSTPYPQVFAPIQRVTPQVVGDALLMTYRSLFILADKFTDLSRAIRLRAGLSRRQPLRAAAATTRAMGGLLLYSLELSQREYDILYLRGYERGFHVAALHSADRTADTATLLYSAILLGVVAAFRWFPGLAGYGWLVTLAGAVDLATGVLIGWRHR